MNFIKLSCLNLKIWIFCLLRLHCRKCISNYKTQLSGIERDIYYLSDSNVKIVHRHIIKLPIPNIAKHPYCLSTSFVDFLKCILLYQPQLLKLNSVLFNYWIRQTQIFFRQICEHKLDYTISRLDSWNLNILYHVQLLKIANYQYCLSNSEAWITKHKYSALLHLIDEIEIFEISIIRLGF